MTSEGTTRPRLYLLRRLLFNNIWLKLLALLLAALIYFTLRSGIRGTDEDYYEKGIHLNAERQV